MTLKKNLDNIIKDLSERQVDIIQRRFGLLGESPKTLAELGKKYGITRERVRQIESSALKYVLNKSKENKEIRDAFNKCVSHLESLGGIRKADFLYNDLKFVLRDNSLLSSYIDLLFSIFGKPIFYQEDANFFDFFFLSQEDLKNGKDFVSKIAKFLKNKKEDIIERKKFDSLFKQAVKGHKFNDSIGLNIILNSKKFSINPYGDIGLSEWPEICPKTIRDKSYLVIKKNGTPMHFRDIAKAINNVNFDSKKAHPQTVHNELIRDSKFVLVGRGLYGLSEFGIAPGTAKEVISRILKKHGPLKMDDVFKLVSKERVYKYNTVLLNLHNKKKFKKLPGGLYHLA